MAALSRQAARGNRLMPPLPVFDSASIAYVDVEPDGSVSIAFDPTDDTRRYILRLTKAEAQRVRGKFTNV